jgi:glc operon protein GlcG
VTSLAITLVCDTAQVETIGVRHLCSDGAVTAVACSAIRKGCWPASGIAREDGSQNEAEVHQMTTTTWTTRPTLSAELSRRLVDAATAGGLRVTVVTVDESGVLREVLRMDGAPLVSLQTAMNKAYAAAAIGMPPDDFFAAIEADPAAVASFANRPGLALLAGGLPVLADGDVAGAIGVAGAMTAAEDRAITEAALEAALAGMAR